MAKKYKCKNCGYETDTLTLGDVRVGCSKCGNRDGFKQYDKKEYDAIMKELM